MNPTESTIVVHPSGITILEKHHGSSEVQIHPKCSLKTEYPLVDGKENAKGFYLGA
jgi:hypothetical protein